MAGVSAQEKRPSPVLYVFPFVAGIGLAVQGGLLSVVTKVHGNPFFGAFVNMSGGALACLMLVALGINRAGLFAENTNAQPLRWWKMTGGVFGATAVTILCITLHELGYVVYSLATIFGQVVGSMMCDHVGFAGVPRREITRVKVLGVMVVLLGMAVSALLSPSAADGAERLEGTSEATSGELFKRPGLPEVAEPSSDAIFMEPAARGGVSSGSPAAGSAKSGGGSSQEESGGQTSSHRGRLPYIILATVGGALLPPQACVNSRMTGVVPFPIYATFVSLFGASLCLSCVVFLTRDSLRFPDVGCGIHWAAEAPPSADAFGGVDHRTAGPTGETQRGLDAEALSTPSAHAAHPAVARATAGYHLDDGACASKWPAPYLYTSGLIGTFALSQSMLIGPRIGIAPLFLLILLGQLVGCMPLDAVGFLGQEVRHVTFARFVGVAIAAAGVGLTALQRVESGTGGVEGAAAGARLAGRSLRLAKLKARYMAGKFHGSGHRGRSAKYTSLQEAFEAENLSGGAVFPSCSP